MTNFESIVEKINQANQARQQQSIELQQSRTPSLVEQQQALAEARAQSAE